MRSTNALCRLCALPAQIQMAGHADAEQRSQLLAKERDSLKELLASYEAVGGRALRQAPFARLQRTRTHAGGPRQRRRGQDRAGHAGHEGYRGTGATPCSEALCRCSRQRKARAQLERANEDLRQQNRRVVELEREIVRVKSSEEQVTP